MATSAEKLRAYEEAFEKAQGYDSAKFSQDFERDYGEATNYNKDLINQQSESLGRLQAVAPEMRERYSSSLIKDPTLQRSLIAQARQAPITDWGQAVGLLDQRGMKYSDILGKHLAGYEGEAQRAERAAESEWRMYQSLLQQEEAAKARAAASRASSGPSLADILAGLPGGGGQPGQGDLDIDVDDRSLGQKTLDVTGDVYNTPFFGSDLSNWQNMNTGQKVLSGLNLVNPLTGVKTFSGLLGNYLGNRKQDNMSFVDKLFNRR